MAIRYFLIKKDDLSRIDSNELELIGKLIGWKTVGQGGKDLFIWEAPMTRSSVKRLMECNWLICNQQMEVISQDDFWHQLEPCMNHWHD